MTPILLWILWLAGLQPAQQRGLPPARASTAKITIEGTVVRASTNEPLPWSTVTLTREAAGRWYAIGSAEDTTSNKPDSVTMSTDEMGKFTFNAAPGRYTLAASKDGFVRQEYGQRG